MEETVEFLDGAIRYTKTCLKLSDSRAAVWGNRPSKASLEARLVKLEARRRALANPELERDLAAERGHFAKVALDLELSGKTQEAEDVRDDLLD